MSPHAALPYSLCRLMPPNVAECRRSLGQILGHSRQARFLKSSRSKFGVQVSWAFFLRWGKARTTVRKVRQA
jgi:hypothetical protein